MVLLSVQGVTKSFAMNCVLKDVNLTLQEGQRMGLIGVNGSGKSTLFKLIAGELEPDSGTISIVRGTRVGMLTQEMDLKSGLTIQEELERIFDPVRQMEARLREIEEQMARQHEDAQAFAKLSADYARLTDRFEEAGGYQWPSLIQGVLAGLGFAKGREHAPASQLSGGEKTRLCLARLLLSQPDLLMLDEPTNHLDLKSTQWLEDTLRRYKGTVLVVSHDRYFLNAICDQMAELSMRRVVQYSGNYDQFMVKRQAEVERQMKEYKMQQAEIARQQAIIERYRMYNREKSIKLAESREKRLEKMELVEKPVSEQKVRFSFQARRRTGDDVLIIKDLAKGFEHKELFANFNLHMRAGDRVAIIGPNGVGKTTLLNIITGASSQDRGTVQFGANVDLGYYDQHQAALHPDKKVIDEIWDDFPRLEADEVRGVLALFLLTGDDVQQPIRTLSGGEKGRVALSKLMLKQDNLLLLDEPTNHLDMDSREVLEAALLNFEGTILTVSHDRYFINRVANRVVEMSSDGVREFIGNYDDYLEKKRQDQISVQEELVQGKTKTQLDKERRKERMAASALKALKKQLKDVEGQIADCEARVMQLEADMADPAVYADPKASVQAAEEHTQVQEKLEELYEQWALLSQRLEDAQ